MNGFTRIFCNIWVEGTENEITVISEKKHVDKAEDTEIYYSEDLETYEHTVEGFPIIQEFSNPNISLEQQVSCFGDKRKHAFF